MSQSPATSLNTDATLQSLRVSGGELVPGFSPQRTSFVVVLPHTADSLEFTPTTTDGAAGLRCDGVAIPSGRPAVAGPLHAGRNAFQLEVTAADGTTTRSYELKAIRAYATPNWVKVLDAAPWAARDSAGELVFDNKLWIFGGYTPELVNDVWCSPDGRSWRQTGAVPGPAGINIPVNFVHEGRMWVVAQEGQLFASRDGATWDMVNARPPWATRYAAGGTAFAGRMWVMGGHGKDGIYNDVWSSADGVGWTRELEHAPWSPRQLFGNVVVHQGRLFVIGGGITSYQPFRAYGDVWSSPDGRAWTKVTDAAPWPARIWSSCAVYRGRIFLLDGFRAQPKWRNLNEVWYSADGANWNRLLTPDVWSERHESSVCVLDEKLWLIGGNAWPLVNDVWQLDIQGLTFTSQPVVEEYAGLQYTYTARADFNRSAGPVRYRLTKSPGWLTMEAESGVIRGRPPEVGAFAVEVEAFDAAGETARQGYTLHVIRI